jgi:hypothetical protein
MNALMKTLLGCLLLLCFTYANAGRYTVTTTNDSGAGSLRTAITSANSNAGRDTVRFNIAGGPHTITLLSALPNISESLFIQGSSQGGSVNGDNNTRTVRIFITSASGSFNAFNISGTVGDVRIMGIAVGNFNGAAVNIESGTTLTTFHLYGCYIGTAANGTTDNSLQYGVRVNTGVTIQNFHIGVNSDNNNAWMEPVLFANCTKSAISVLSAVSTKAIIGGNYFGVKKDGSTASVMSSASTAENGIIEFYNSSNIVIGSEGDGNDSWIEPNTIASADMGVSSPVRSLSHGIYLNNCSNIWIGGNLIGTESTGTSARNNYGRGVQLTDCSNAFIGFDDNKSSSNAGATRNTICANYNGGIGINNGTNITVTYNFIGTNSAYATTIGNGSTSVYAAGDGVYAWGTNSNIVIGTDGDHVNDDFERNIIGRNAYNGIKLTGSNCKVSGNCIGMGNVTAFVPLGNGANGVEFINSTNSQIGNTGTGNSSQESYKANYIGNNGGDAINISGSTAIKISGNFCGSANNGSNLIAGNTGNGINILNSDYILIGGRGTISNYLDMRNHIVNNWGVGIKMHNTNRSFISGNFIGCGTDGMTNRGNTGSGMELTMCMYDTLGTDGDLTNDGTERNIISFNGGHGIFIDGTGLGGTYPHFIANNFVGVNSAGSGTTTNNTGNGKHGIYLINSGNNIIGTNSDGKSDNLERNVITSNGRGLTQRNGLHIENCDNTVIKNNMIGVDSWGGNNGAGAGSKGNYGHGIYLNNCDNTIIGTEGDGTNDAGERNTISFNDYSGIKMEYCNNNKIANNYIGVASWGFQDYGNAQCGIEMENSDNNTIGTNGNNVSDDQEKNVIGFNDVCGIKLTQSNNNRFAFNYVGEAMDGWSGDCPNYDGIALYNSNNNFFGTDANGISDAHEVNVIVTNTNYGIILSGSNTYNNTFSGNYIGVGKWFSLSGTGRPNLGAGGVIELGAHDNLIGSNHDGVNDALETNIIAYNGKGLIIKDNNTIQNKITRNSFFDNGGSAIDLGNFNGVTPNNGTVTATANNTDLDYPVISNTNLVNPTTLRLSGYVGDCGGSVTNPGTIINIPLTIEVYKLDNSPVDQDGRVTVSTCGATIREHGEGRTYVGRTSIASGLFNNITINSVVSIAAGDSLTSIAIDANGNTSEFGALVVMNTLPEALNQTFVVQKENDHSATIFFSGVLNPQVVIAEKSIDGVNWQFLCYASGSNGTYTAKDMNLIPGKNYYRLQLVHNNGQRTYTETKMLEHADDAFVRVFPTVVNDQFTIIQSKMEGVHTATLINMSGMVLKRIPLLSSRETVTGLSAFPAGTYFLKITGLTNVQTVKISIQH